MEGVGKVGWSDQLLCNFKPYFVRKGSIGVNAQYCTAYDERGAMRGV